MAGQDNFRLSVRTADPDDFPEILQLIADAFPEEELVPLTERLLANGAETDVFVAIAGEEIAGVVFFTNGTISGSDTKAKLLGPLAVRPELQKSGIGSLIVRKGIDAMRDKGAGIVLVLGDPAYYGRFGFGEEASVTPPYALPEEWKPAWQSLRLNNALQAEGALNPGSVWMDKALWLP